MVGTGARVWKDPIEAWNRSDSTRSRVEETHLRLGAKSIVDDTRRKRLSKRPTVGGVLELSQLTETINGRARALSKTGGSGWTQSRRK